MPRKSWWARLPFGVRMTAGASAVLMVIGGGTAGIAQLTKSEPRIVTQATDDHAVAAPPAAPAGGGSGRGLGSATDLGGGAPQKASTGDDEPARPIVGEPVQRAARNDGGERAVPRTPAKKDEAPPKAAAPPVTVAEPAPPTQPRVTTRTETESRAIPFRTRLVRDPALPRGAKRIQTPGVLGEEVLRYVVTVTDGRATERRLLDSRVTRQPQARVVAFGTRRKDCKDDRCGPLWRNAACERPVESAATLPLLDGEAVKDDLDGLELEPGLLC